MSPSGTHPQIDNPPDDELSRLLEKHPPAVRQAYLAAHRLVLEAVPGVRYSVDTVDAQIGYGARQFGYDGWGMAGLSPHRNWVTLAFLRGAALDDPEGLLEGTGASVRHVKLKSVEQLAERRAAITALFERAASLNLE
jgi:hypothetical protein